MAGTYSCLEVWHFFYEDPFLLFNDNVTVHFHILSVSCKMLLHQTCFSALVSAHQNFDVSTGPNSDYCSRLFYNLKLHFYQEKISLTQKVLA